MLVADSHLSLCSFASLTPHANALMAYMSLFDGAGLGAVVPQVAILAGMGVLLLALAVWRFRFD